ncbi:MAG: peptidoglycan-binding protein, partial [Bryobacterales bacterium]|nr:peptidoglycan-binding protein [Bryobacterales bacterium]
MLIVNQGVQGPRAVALQILLNRFGATGTPLKVDGHYGRKTASAVAAFRREILKSPGPGSSTDLAFWQSMLRLTQLQTIEAVDVTDPMLTETAVPELQKQKANPIMLGGTSNGVDQLMRLIGLEARGMGSVLLLRFHAHGGPGLVAVSHGTRKISPGIDPNHELTVLNEITVGKLRPVLESIAPIFANFGFVEFHACKVAQGGKGEKFLETLADIWRVPVTAPLSSQSATHAVFALSGATCTF